MKIIFAMEDVMEKQQSVMDIINIRYDSFFEQEKKIANYIMQHHKDVVNMTIGELAEASGASVATVSRFCRKCDVDGFHHLKISLAKEIVEGDQDVTVSNDISRKDIGQSLQNILANKVEELKQTVSLIDEKELNEVLDHIQNAGTVQLVAVGNTIPVALDGAFKLNKIRIRLALIFLHEGINVPKAAAAAMIAAGIYLMIEKKDKRMGANIRCAFSCLLTGCLI